MSDGKLGQTEGKIWIYRYGKPIQVDVRDPRHEYADRKSSGYSLVGPDGNPHPDQPVPSAANTRLLPGVEFPGVEPAGGAGGGGGGGANPLFDEPVNMGMRDTDVPGVQFTSLEEPAEVTDGDTGFSRIPPDTTGHYRDMTDLLQKEEDDPGFLNDFVRKKADELQKGHWELTYEDVFGPWIPDEVGPDLGEPEPELGSRRPPPGMAYGNRQSPPGMQPDPNVAVPGYIPGIDSRDNPPFDPNQPFGYEQPEFPYDPDLLQGEGGMPNWMRRSGAGPSARSIRRGRRQQEPVPQEITQYTPGEPATEPEGPGGQFFGSPDMGPADLAPSVDLEDARSSQEVMMSAAVVEQMIVAGYDDYLVENGVLSRGEIAKMRVELIRQGKLDEEDPRRRVEGGLADATAPGSVDPSDQLGLIQRIKIKRAANKLAKQQGGQ